MASQNTRKATDLRKLIKNGYKVEMINDNVDEFHVFLEGPPDSLYSKGVWKVAVKLPEDYPSKPPSIEFKTTIYHPNIQLKFGWVCLDVLKGRNWIPSYNLLMVFDYFLPQLLMTPNAEDPWNKEAAALLMSNKANYEVTVKAYCNVYAKPKKWEWFQMWSQVLVLVLEMRQWLLSWFGI